jgi:4-hydroxybenzoate polyprenyltransferase
VGRRPFLGLAFNWGTLLAWAAHDGGIGAPAVALYLAGIAWTLFYDTIYAHQDREDDALIGVRSTARLFGNRTKAWLAGFWSRRRASRGSRAQASAQSPVQLALAWTGVAGFSAHLAWQLRRLDVDDPQACLALFRSNRDAGLILALGLAAAALA